MEKNERRYKFIRGYIFFSFFFIALTFVDRMPWVDNLDLGVDPAWGTNSELLYSMAIYLNLVYFSFIPVLVTLVYYRKNLVTLLPPVSIALFWMLFFYRSFYSDSSESSPTLLAYAIYSTVFISFILLSWGYIKKFRKIKLMEELEQFQEKTRQVIDKIFNKNLPDMKTSNQRASESVKKTRDMSTDEDVQSETVWAEKDLRETDRSIDETEEELRKLK